MNFSYAIGAVTGFAIAVTLATEVRGNFIWGLVIFISGIISRHAIGDAINTVTTKSKRAWMYDHARAYANGLHKQLNPYNCKNAQCARKRQLITETPAGN